MAGILYNVTVKIDSEIEKEWLDWMRVTHIPEVLQTGCFTECVIRKLKYPEDLEGATYTFQYSCRDMLTLERYHSEFASALQKDHTERYSNKFVAFRTILEDVDTFDV